MLTFKRVNILSIVLLASILAYGFWFDKITYPYIVLLFMIWLTFTSIGSFNILWNYFLEAKHRNKNCEQNVVSLTFDDGVHPKFTPLVLELLKKNNMKATFFCIGKNVEKYPEIAKKIVDQGHTIGNHTYHHANNWGFLNTDEVIAEITKTNEIIEKTIGESVRIFRPPFGVTNPSIARGVKWLNCEVIGWSVRSLDTVIEQPERILKRITSKVKKGDIILLHDTSEKSIMVLERLLQFLNKKKLKSVTVQELLGLSTKK